MIPKSIAARNLVGKWNITVEGNGNQEYWVPIRSSYDDRVSVKFLGDKPEVRLYTSKGYILNLATMRELSLLLTLLREQ
jgi:hypothetical protein